MLLERDILLDVAYTLLKELDVKVSKSTFSKEIKSHPDYPSLLSISDTLKYFGVDNLPIQASPASLEPNMLPCLVQIQHKEGDVLSIVRSINGSNVSYLNPTTLRYSSKSLESFADICSNNLLLVEPTLSAKQNHDRESLLSDRQRHVLNTVALLLVPVLTLLLTFYLYTELGSGGWPYIAYNVLLLVGATATMLLLMSSLHVDTSLVKMFCGSAASTSPCSQVSGSKGAKLFGHSLVLLGGTFFLGSLLFLILQAAYAPVSYHFLFFLNVLVVPVIVYSLYQQAFVLRKWCALCLIVQSVLVLQLTVGFYDGWIQQIIFQESQVILSSTLIVCLSFVYLILNLLVPYIATVKKEQQKLFRFERLKKDPTMFQDLLSVQQPIVNENKLLGFRFGFPDAEINIVKVCNPYCDPCSRAHAILDEIIDRNDNVCLQIIFSRPNNDQHADTIRHFLSLSRQYDQSELKAAIYDWYLSDQKDLRSFKEKYPSIHAEKFDHEMENMQQWCVDNDIRYTPTIYINGRRIPSFYTVEDLKYFLL
ncbi:MULTISPECIES: vitamin K epoxide reductase family protein [Olivibacter]|uniref:Vitamin K epoxide reductase family protein n=2 Tax=Olivibacter TaxID=376469 RepID=A0ABV6HQC2_9SPHI|nr:MULTISPECIES: vitamin K epoxide reductase family protein [unclassified Olivibacter]MCL4640445.1 thioredoxin domain-containing protein [Olivibacter sp. UJ_SKK_5.1]MDM8173696.1 vitamin K epoxide reductase family protein [Olivibacter sp. 47]MDX3914870.1 vitamin K epoxide reductase family protein [Pseudosphingobacterium sp.]